MPQTKTQKRIKARDMRVREIGSLIANRAQYSKSFDVDAEIERKRREVENIEAKLPEYERSQPMTGGVLK